ncbi:hypothetical protein JRO89_XS02G0193200 [Xanthoceras sorbifolium]|uniref:Erythromycin biosynthesis protein CIII-like C-terminal domain-containing protein n=1 Tax=Xanthoceras sorbifolium TaxID=99658 RepID=A0ABQ8IGD1_9ROSI|nr:hypothetical protein JRO89_XS02G0193200 [Xanthoceras sorbifolium]
METETERTKPVAAFMAFGTKGDVYPLAAIAAAFACDQKQYHVVLVTHSAHENLKSHLAGKCVSFCPISSPPVLSVPQNHDTTGSVLKVPVSYPCKVPMTCYLLSDSLASMFQQRKREITNEHRKECYSAVERVFGNGPSMEGDFVVINFFALEGWSLAELFRVRCIVAAPYVVPYSAPSSFEQRFIKEYPLLYKYLREAPINKVCWKDVIHWMWPLFTENWGLWRSEELNLSPCPFTDPVTGLPTWHERASSPILLYGFSKEIVECPNYWPSNVRCCGFWFLPVEWQFSCKNCAEISALLSSRHLKTEVKMCLARVELQAFLEAPISIQPIFIGLSSVARQVLVSCSPDYFRNCEKSCFASLCICEPCASVNCLFFHHVVGVRWGAGFLENPQAFLLVLKRVLEATSYRFILFTAGYEPLNAAIQVIAMETSSVSNQRQFSEDGINLFDGLLFCFSGTLPYNLLFPRCAAAIHHGGSGSTAAALSAGIPQVPYDELFVALSTALEITCEIKRNKLHIRKIICPFMLDQFYWAERMFWIGVAPEPLKRKHLVPDNVNDMCIKEAAESLLGAIHYALSPKVKALAVEIAERISIEDGVSEAVKILKEEIGLF